MLFRSPGNSGLYINPVRNDATNITYVLYYNTSTKEITYTVPTGGTYANTNVAAYLPTYTGTFGTLSSLTSAGNITVNSPGYFLGNGSTLSMAGFSGTIGGTGTNQIVRGATVTLSTAGGNAILQADGSFVTGALYVTSSNVIASGAGTY